MTDRELLQDTLEELGAFKTKHSGRTLSEHLLNTYDMLVQSGCSRDVCLAGGLHSVFGTNAFRHKSTTDREMIAKRFGSDVERLVAIFSSQDRPRCWELEFLTWLDASDMHNLRLIEAANLIEQGESLKRFPRIEKTWMDQCH